MNAKNINLISKIQFENLYNEISYEDREFIENLLKYANDKNYIFFHLLKPEERKRLEIEYVKEYKQCKNNECKKQYLEKIYFGNLFFIIKKSLKAYKKRFNDSIKLHDLLTSVFIILPKILNKYDLNNKWNARFLSYFEKFLEAILIKQISNNSVFTISLDEIEYMKRNNNFDQFDVNEHFLKDENEKSDYNYEINYLAKNYENLSSDIEYEIKEKAKKEIECDCLEEIYLYYFKNQINEKILSCLIKTLNSYEILNCIKNKI